MARVAILLDAVRLLHGLGPERLRRRLTGPGSFVKRGAATEARMERKAACCFKHAMSSEASCLASPAP